MQSRILRINQGGGFDSVSITTSDIPAINEHQILVKIKASSLNYHDYAVVSGMWGPTEDRIPMSDGAGEIVAIGTNVKNFKVGDHVVSTFFPDWDKGEPIYSDFKTVPGDGVDGYARDYVAVDENFFTKAPKLWTHLESSTLTTAALTAWRALFEDTQITKNDTILIQGTGGVSIYALQFAKMIGARVVATSSSDDKIKRLYEFGADYCINYKKNPEWGNAVLDWTNGQGVDYVVDVGGPNTINHSLTACKVNGHISFIGILSGLDGKLDMINLLLKQIKIQGVLVGNRQHQLNMINAINQYQFKPVIDKVFPFESLIDAFKHQESNQHFGKICIQY
ncbi:alcohol dehydrogenase [Methylophilales bacterium MBRSG12]|uniref:Alcohol dehydrogenase n=1 Tax=Methylophilales bacterium MBRS-H7 TaxID=1623450 RepID=A0A0H4JCN1_9PROT|nr:alcohol dehydrogenase [Methylophilales bacterium MBRSF5]AKO66272.1 alcohol dehydrogenase [Methylophilales bacterium MBRS-H7]AKO67590.1 alcohol dehydrogenase [Methylophilales bacterium MBRSG12]